MMKWTRYMLLMPVLMVQALSSCSLIDEPEYTETGNVDVSLAFTVSSAVGGSTRMADNVVQEQGSGRSYRGLGNVSLIPFAITGDRVTISNTPSRLLEEASLLLDNEKADNNLKYGGFYLYNVHTLNMGINAFLVYGRPPQNIDDKAINGSLQVPDLINPNLKTLRFKPDPIFSGTEPPEESRLLAGYLTYIAEATGNSVSWSNTTDPTLKSIYLNFIGQENNDNLVMAGSTANVIAHVNALFSNIVAFTPDEDGLINNILTRIKNPQGTGLTLISTGENNTWKLTGIKKTVNGESVEFVYPASVGLPDGAAAIQWGEVEKNNVIVHEFIPRIKTTPQTSINNIDRYCYPPELFYYANSRINTSNEEIENIDYQIESDWDNLLAKKYKNENAMVTGRTQSIAIRQPLQYAVGRLKMSMQAKTTTGNLKDAANKDVPLTNSSTSTSTSSFPLTGVIICNQHPVGFDFKPVFDAGAASHAEDHFIYDTQVGTNYLTTTETSIPSTLVLQSYDTGEGVNKADAEEITIALEFRNDSGQKFKGKDGVIYDGTKFYLIGKIDPTTGTTTDENARGRVFTQDYITTITTSVNSLANAYNVLPDLLGGRLELGVKLTTNWIQAETTNVILQ